METKLIIIVCVAILSLFLSIFGIRLFVYLSLKSMGIINKTFNNKKKKVLVTVADEDLKRDLKTEQKQKQEQLKRGNNLNPALEQEVARMRNEQIVDVAKPVGFWTSKVIGDGLTSMMKDRNISWRDLILQKTKTRQRQHDRGGRLQ
ncbi:MAG: hypothetical protein Ta2D_10570 [Rickettsiales bacterium]|nr:MAG: hypothetical protein Ta2D_10570 [Rickettsiales bacterium]